MVALGQTVLYMIAVDDLRFMDWRGGGGYGRGKRPDMVPPPTPGDVLPLIVTKVLIDANPGLVAGQVLMNGGDTLWIAEAPQGTGPGTYALM